LHRTRYAALLTGEINAPLTGEINAPIFYTYVVALL
jgi:hypothetical protein